jgi:hypothetical protein
MRITKKNLSLFTEMCKKIQPVWFPQFPLSQRSVPKRAICFHPSSSAQNN